MAGSGGSSDVRVAGERVQDHHHVVPCGRQFAPALHGDTDIVDHRPAFQLQRADVYQADFAFGGQRLGGYIGDRHVRIPQNAATDCGSALNLRAAAKPSSRSARISSIPSMPTAKRTRPGLTPVASCSAGLSWA
ncbi:Uncharacterised protein [Mycobacterium tuberculosis]|uniref:Uncharacterized protein n=1 Tax=Mycobacterium tuberculosis TaxID=1773 RepID=A0A655DK84_MYCTX|nr:Uncharacterised protein [Mycobacterium tuberculosis]CKS58187.1 Uncharacterised protein [Mycobacterium tuberculosis]CKU67453.1 Uncharacterised protein [Mycobacterium tuberculosis]CKU76713.1 Uncharacterised protein [Mycobacterium tuberculosis]CNM39676.1 Uncharacterised protein [Mycobacterium tuberculosis]